MIPSDSGLGQAENERGARFMDREILHLQDALVFEGLEQSEFALGGTLGDVSLVCRRRRRNRVEPHHAMGVRKGSMARHPVLVQTGRMFVEDPLQHVIADLSGAVRWFNPGLFEGTADSSGPRSINGRVAFVQPNSG